MVLNLRSSHREVAPFARGQRGILDGRKRFPGIKRGTKLKVKRLQGFRQASRRERRRALGLREAVRSEGRQFYAIKNSLESQGKLSNGPEEANNEERNSVGKEKR